MKLTKFGVKIFYVVALVLVPALFFMACGGGSSPGPASLGGRWVLENEEDPYGDNSYYRGVESLELTKNGSGIVDERSVTWVAENGRLLVMAVESGRSFGYTLSGGILTLTDDEGRSVRFKKK
ncbi:MAG: hypothetical protein LBL56_04690 [Treponema sp.]|jgi:hypothetical protein|nr:hypothetical protein [Treponema sp.]